MCQAGRDGIRRKISSFTILTSEFRGSAREPHTTMRRRRISLVVTICLHLEKKISDLFSNTRCRLPGS